MYIHFTSFPHRSVIEKTRYIRKYAIHKRLNIYTGTGGFSPIGYCPITTICDVKTQPQYSHICIRVPTNNLYYNL